MSRLRKLFAFVALLGLFPGQRAYADGPVQYYTGAGVIYSARVTCNAGWGTQTTSFPIPPGFAGDVSIHGSGGDNAALITAAADDPSTVINHSLPNLNIISWPNIVKTGTNQWAIQNCAGNQGTPNSVDFLMTGTILGQMPYQVGALGMSDDRYGMASSTSSFWAGNVTIPAANVAKVSWDFGGYGTLLLGGTQMTPYLNFHDVTFTHPSGYWSVSSSVWGSSPQYTEDNSFNPYAVQFFYQYPGTFHVTMTVTTTSGATYQAATDITMSAPPTPTGLHKTGSSATNINLAWNPVPGVDGYQVYVDELGLYFTVPGGGSSTGTASEWDIVLGQYYHIRIQSYTQNTWGTNWGPWSDYIYVEDTCC